MPEPAKHRDTVRAITDVLAGPVAPGTRAAVASLLTQDALRPAEGLRALDLHRSTYDRLARLVRHLPASGIDSTDPAALLALAEWTAVVDPSLCIATVIHYALCIGTLAEFAHDDPTAVGYLRALESGGLAGAFMITEIGAGNSQLAVRTEAVFDPAAREFVLHTPDDGALKFTNAGISDRPKLGVVCARLVVGGADRGVFPFVLMLSDGAGPRPGVRMSSPAEIPLVPFDYALAGFDHVRLPYIAWLRDTARIDPDGAFHDPLGDPDLRLLRTLVGPENVWAMASVALAAVGRASAALALGHSVRRRTMARIAPESVLLNYRTQRRALFGALATSYVATCLANDAARDWSDRIRGRRSPGTAATAPMTWAPWAPANRALALAKAVAAWAAEETAAECRLRCGVAGELAVNRFQSYEGLGHVFNDAGGNNLLTLLDTARALVAAPDIRHPPTAPDVASPTDPRRWLFLARSLEYRLVAELSDAVAGEVARSRDSFDRWNPHLETAREAGRAHADRRALEAAVTTTAAVADPRARSLLHTLTAVHALRHQQRAAGRLIGEGLLETGHHRSTEDALNELCDTLADHTDALVEAFGYPPTATGAPLGHVGSYASALAGRLTWTG
ncbi:acyl-CoA dehydrogenase [Kitasatospora sp. NPDC059463]|uniref:acyl-CoA dehydrogenase n=1 Tax=unclassified Kitasatospora TaxID=2633591 RepID=UPI00367E141F